MPKPLVFPYGITLREGGQLDTFPAVEVLLPYKTGGNISVFLIVDSGAYISALPQNDAASLGIDPEKGVPTKISGIGDQVLNGWRHEVRVRLGPELILLPVVFIESDHTPRILGRLGVFDKYTIIFDEPRRRTGFLDVKKGRSLVDALLSGSG